MKTRIVASGLSALLALIDPSSAQTAVAATTTYVQIIVTPILLPSALFTSAPQSQYFSGDVRSSSSTTFYTVWRDLVRDNDSFTDFAPALVTHYDWFGYTFSASPAGTQYVWQNLTINCPSATPFTATATCTTTSTNLDNTDFPSYHTLAESSFYGMIFSNINATEEGPRTTPTLLKVGIGLGVPLGICLCVIAAVLIYRHREHKLHSRVMHAAGTNDVKVVNGVDGGKNGFAAYGDGGGGVGVAVREMGLGDGAADDGFRASEALANELDGENGREELA